MPPSFMRGVARRAGGSPDICNANIRTVHIAIQCGLDPSDPVAPGFARIHRATSPINREARIFSIPAASAKKGRSPFGKRQSKEEKKKLPYRRNSIGSTGSSSLVTVKWTWSPRAFSIRALVPTVPMVCPMVTGCPALTATSAPREEYRVV